MKQELLDELCEWCFEKGRERPAVSMIVGVPLCESCSNDGSQSRFEEKKVQLFEPERGIPPVRAVPVPKKEPEPVKANSLWDNHKPCACGCKSPVKKSDPAYLPGHEPEPPKPQPKSPTRWEEFFKQLAPIGVGESITVSMPEGGTRSQMNSALNMNSMTRHWRWSLTAHRDGTVTAKKVEAFASFFPEPEKPKVKEKPMEKPPLELKRIVTLFIPSAKPCTQVKVTPAIANAIWNSLTLAEKAKIIDIETMWNEWDDWLRTETMSKILLISPDDIDTAKRETK